MGVSTESVNPDLNALMSGGDAFLKRVAELKAAQESYDQSLAALNLGQSAVDANKKAQATLADASNKRDADTAALEAEIKSARDSVATWSQQTKDEALALRQQAAKANEDAQNLKQSAEDDRALARQALIEADNVTRKTVAEATAKADKIILDAKAEASRLTSDAAKAKSELEASLIVAQETEAKFKAKLAAIQVATAAALRE